MNQYAQQRLRSEPKRGPVMGQSPHALITGGAGFIGTNLTHRLLREGWSVTVLDNLSRPGVEINLHGLEAQHDTRLTVEIGDVRDRAAVRRAMCGTAIVVHLAGQVSVVDSVVSPAFDWQVNVGGTLNVLEVARKAVNPPLILFTSTNKVYGSLLHVPLTKVGLRYQPVDARVRSRGVSESAPLSLTSPYSRSKAAAERYVVGYARSGRVPALVFRMSCVYGPHQLGHERQGWISHFMTRALEEQPVTIFGDGRQVRDLLFADDLVDAFLLVAGAGYSLAGNVFNLGGGPAHACSLLDVWKMIENLTELRQELDFANWREADQRWYVTDSHRFRERTTWQPTVSVDSGLRKLHDWLIRTRGLIPSLSGKDRRVSKCDDDRR